MRQTENYGLNLPETADLLSPKPLNENAEKVDAALAALAAGCVMMASGSYTGNGAGSVTIQTPGFTPKVVLMRQKREIGVDETGVVYTDTFSVDGGWARWAGEESLTTNVYAPDVYHASDGSRGIIGRYEITFTAKKGSLTWATHYGVFPDINKNINNSKGVTYEWIAFGYGEGDG